LFFIEMVIRKLEKAESGLISSQVGVKLEILRSYGLV